MYSILTSTGLVLATAMAVSVPVIFLAFRREKNFSPTHFAANQDSDPTRPVLQSCLSSGDGKKREKRNRRVRFADSVEDQTGDGEDYRKKSTASRVQRSCKGEIDETPANRVAAYSGILRECVQRLECSY